MLEANQQNVSFNVLQWRRSSSRWWNILLWWISNDLLCPQVTSSSQDWVQACTATCPNWWPPEKVSRAAWPHWTSTVGCRTCWATPCSAAARSTEDVKVLRPWGCRPTQSTAQSSSTPRPAPAAPAALGSIGSGETSFCSVTSFTWLTLSSEHRNSLDLLFTGTLLIFHDHVLVAYDVIPWFCYHVLCWWCSCTVQQLRHHSADAEKCLSDEMSQNVHFFVLVVYFGCLCLFSFIRRFLQISLKSLMHNFAFVSFLLLNATLLSCIIKFTIKHFFILLYNTFTHSQELVSLLFSTVSLIWTACFYSEKLNFLITMFNTDC